MMGWQAEEIVFWTTLVLAVLGAASVIAALRCRCSVSGTHFQRLFVFCLVGTGGTTMIALSLHNNCWLSCAVSCACLAVCATVDTGRARAERAVAI